MVELRRLPEGLGTLMRLHISPARPALVSTPPVHSATTFQVTEGLVGYRGVLHIGRRAHSGTLR